MRSGLVAVLLLLATVQAAVAPVAAQASAVDLRSAPWSHAGCVDPATTDGLPTGACRHMRILLSVDVPQELRGMSNLPVTTTLDVAAALGSMAGYPSFPNGQLMGFELDLDSLILVEVTAGTWEPARLDNAQVVTEPLLSFEGDIASPQPYDPRSNPVVTLQWVLSGATQGPRHYLLYLDSLHQGDKAPIRAQESELGRVAAAVGPGRGNTAYVSLHGDLGLATSSDPRTLRITNLQATEVKVDVYEYERFNVPKGAPEPEMRDRTLAAGVGQVLTIPLRTEYTQEAVKVVARGGLVLVEASSRVGASSFQPASSRLFLPSGDGGYVGSFFTGQSPVATNWLVFCPAIVENEGPCQVMSSAGSASIPVGSFATLAVPPAPTSLRATTGLVAVERIPASASPQQLGLTLWPPLDGPIGASLFAGHANSDSEASTVDKLMLVPSAAGSRLDVRSLVGARTILADNFDPRGPGLFSDAAGGAWGTAWLRDWRLESNPQARPTHEDGAVRITDRQGKGLAVSSGTVRSDSAFSAFIPPLTTDGGITYLVTIPADSSGNALGRIALFSPFGGTDVDGKRIAGGSSVERTVEALQPDEYVRSFIDEPGTWEVTANHPVLLTWVKVGTDPMAGFAPALTLGVEAEPVAAQFAGYAYQLDATLFQTVTPTKIATFEVTVENRARRTDGVAIQDSVNLEATPPSGWPDADPIPSLLILPPGESRKSRVESQVPNLNEAELAKGGATVQLHTDSVGSQRGYVVELPLRINYEISRGVDLTADGKDGTAERAVTADEVANFVVRVTNTGAVPDSFHMEFAPPASPWSLAVECPDVDSCFEGGGEHTTPELQPGHSLEYVFGIRTDSKTAARLTTPVLATSQGDPSRSDVVRLLTVLDAERKLSVIIEETSQVVLPGGAANFTITFKNDGEQDEEVRLGVNGTRPASWSGPGILVDDPDFDAPVPLANLNNTFGVRLQQSVRLLVRQPVPATAPPGQIMVMRLTVRTGHGDAGRDASEHQLRVISGRSSGLNITGLAEALDILPGTAVELPITIHSSSNAAQVVRLHGTVQPTPRDWNVTVDGKPGPWVLNLTAGGSAALKVLLSASTHAPATSFIPSTLLLQLSVPGASIVPAKVKLRVPDALDVAVLDTSLRLEAGRSQEVLLHLRNAGNVPVQATGSFPDLEWPARWGNATVAPGQDGTLRVWLEVPTTTSVRSATLRLVDRATGTVLATPTLAIEVRTPQLEVEVTGTRALANGLRSYTLEVTNHAAAPARMVQIQLLQGERVLDAAVLESILPGATGTAHLVSSAHDSLSLRIRSSDDPAGRTIALESLPGIDAVAARPASAPTALAALALAALALALRRRA